MLQLVEVEEFEEQYICIVPNHFLITHEKSVTKCSGDTQQYLNQGIQININMV